MVLTVILRQLRNFKKFVHNMFFRYSICTIQTIKTLYAKVCPSYLDFIALAFSCSYINYSWCNFKERNNFLTIFLPVPGLFTINLKLYIDIFS